MTIIRIPGYCAGSDLSGEPVDWLVYDTETKERRIEVNPLYVPPPEPTELEREEWELADLERRVESKRRYVEMLRNEAA